MDALIFIWVFFLFLCLIGCIIIVSVENSAELEEELKQLKKEYRILRKEYEFLKLMNELKGVKSDNEQER